MTILKLYLQCTEMFMRELAETVAEMVEYRGEFVQDTGKPDGTMRKVMDISRIRGLGWQPQVSLEVGIKLTYQNFVTQDQRS